ncbi:hypothetical protein BLOT_003239 [Blomia tropicalis]|nr:hypothetical protein BLOT_003239 [Blomia tropicalis]WBV73487.1 allergen [Blomia tropicalis]
MASNAPHDSVFDVVPIGSSFFFIWRVKEFNLIPVPKEEYGKFYKGDSYVVICCTEYRTGGHSNMPIEPLKTGGIGMIDIHFWIGSNSSQDESAVAAIKTVELDDFLGGTPVQHREVEGHESKQFLSYFRNGIRLLNGGFESGFHKVDKELHPSLYQVKGKKRPVMHELNEIKWSSINNGDVFLLVVPKYIFVWVGKSANHFERLSAINIANELKNELSRFHLSIVIVDDGQEAKQLSSNENTEFNRYLPLESKDSQIKPADEFDWTSDEKFEKAERKFVHLYHCKEFDDKILIKSVKDGPLTRSDLDSNDSFIVDNGANGIWVWVGKDASTKERSSGLRYAMELIKDKEYPAKTEVTKVIEGGETIEFRSLFKQWSTVKGFSAGEKQARLFNLTKKGKFAQIINFEKHDLEEDNVMILDVGEKLFVWLGSQLQEKLADESKVGKIAEFYLKKDKSGRQLEPAKIIYVKQGSENDEFKSYFKSWN